MSASISANTTWSPACAGVYVLDSDTTVAPGTMLTVSPGTIVKSSGYALTVSGTITATGTTAQPISFTSLKDDSQGGDTNADGASSAPASGDWFGIVTEKGSKATLDHVAVSYAGGGAYHDQVDCGLEIQGPGVTVTNSKFSNIAGPAVYIAGGTTAVPDSWLSGNTATNDWINGVLIEGGFVFSANSTLSDTPQWELIISPTATIPAGVTLTIDPGAVIKFSGGDTSLDVKGTLLAQGTATNPIAFTSIQDNSIGGPTGLSYPTTTAPASGDWLGIRFSADTLSDRIDHVYFAYASTAVSIGNLNFLSVTNSQFSYDDAAFEVDGTTQNDPVLAFAGAAVGDCVPPYTSEIDATTDYFGVSGYPGASMDLLGFVGETLPDNGLLQGTYAAATNAYAVEAKAGDNTIPYALFDCLGVSFPVTPILIGGGTVLAPGAPVVPVLPFDQAHEKIIKER